jgi:hypothetical protein
VATHRLPPPFFTQEGEGGRSSSHSQSHLTAYRTLRYHSTQALGHDHLLFLSLAIPLSSLSPFLSFPPHIHFTLPTLCFQSQLVCCQWVGDLPARSLLSTRLRFPLGGLGGQATLTCSPLVFPLYCFVLSSPACLAYICHSRGVRDPLYAYRLPAPSGAISDVLYCWYV